MNFRAHSLQPVAGATGVVSRVQLPATGHIAISYLDAGRPTPLSIPSISAAPLRMGTGHQQARHRVQCRANCMSKANF